jgi:hypothetical protein
LFILVTSPDLKGSFKFLSRTGGDALTETEEEEEEEEKRRKNKYRLSGTTGITILFLLS